MTPLVTTEPEVLRWDNWLGRFQLICPLCKGNNLHFKNVEVDDKTEDAMGAIRVKVSTCDILRFKFWCESCEGATITLELEHHEGTTYVSYEGHVGK